MKKTSLILSIIFLSISSACSQKENYPPIQDFDENLFELVKIIDGIDIPWGLAFTDNTSFLVTDKKGILYHVVDGKKKIIQGVPDIVFSRQGGLLDVAVDENFVSNQIIYFTASVSESEKGSNTSLFSAKLDGDILVDIKQLYKASPDSEEERHFGGSILLKNQHIYFTIGDRGNRDVNPQNINLDGGKVYRLNLDGSIPFDNPFFNSDNSKKAIWSFGHRNPQGIVNGFNLIFNKSINEFNLAEATGRLGGLLQVGRLLQGDQVDASLRRPLSPQGRGQARVQGERREKL